MSVNDFERRCMELFGECPLTIQDIFFIGENLYGAAWMYYRKEQNNFLEALENWSEGNKLSNTLEEARKRNQYYSNAEDIVAKETIIDGDPALDWTAFPKDNPEICFYQGLPFDDELCVWAENYIESKKSNA